MWALSKFDLYLSKYFNQVLQFFKSILDGIAASLPIRWKHLDLTTYILAFVISNIILRCIVQCIRGTALKAAMKSYDESAYNTYKIFDAIAFTIWTYKVLFTCSADKVQYPALGQAIYSNLYAVLLLIGGIIYYGYQTLVKYLDFKRRQESGIPIAELEKPMYFQAVNLIILNVVACQIILKYDFGIFVQIIASVLSNVVSSKLFIF